MSKGRISTVWTAFTLFAVGCEKRAVEVKDSGKAPGSIMTIDSTGDAGYYVALDLDGDDRFHLVYLDRKGQVLRYVRQQDNSFSADSVDEDCAQCQFAAIRVTDKGEPHVAYYKGSTQILQYAHRGERGWLRETIEWGQNTGMGVSLLFDDQQALHAVYYSGDGYLKHAWRSPPKKGSVEGAWGSERVDRANGTENVLLSFVRQPSGRLAVSYFHWSGPSSELRLATLGEGNKWSTEVVVHENSPGKTSALYFTETGEPRLVFREAMKDRIVMAALGIEGWKAVPLVDRAYNMALTVDSNRNMLLAYEKLSSPDPRKGTLRMARFRDNAWTDFEVDHSPGTGTYLAAGLTAKGRPVIAYFDEGHKSLRLFLGE